ncbi:MAG: SDR family NAD(P)-dependent oxidoreductase [Microbacterium sp.]|uniref:SDR family NAD(P)-dependent oxidoreductase n=1 Tax=Microbacterium sp. TaxID=51671 RepID=UPI003A8A55CB
MAVDESPGWDPRALPELSGRAYLVTGSNKGLGFFSAEQLARAGARVIMTGRNPNRLAAAKAAITRRLQDASLDADLETLLLDTSNLGSIRASAATVRARKKLDGVLLNAGIVHAPRHRQTTPDGNEIVFATNALGHYALAGELLLSLAAARGRMVWIGSISTALWRYEVTDPQLEHGYSPWRAYVQSKIVTAALGFEADRRLRAANVPVASVVAHPGYSTSGRTPRIRGVNEVTRLRRFTDQLQRPINQSKEHGAWPLVRALTDPGITGGEFWGPHRRTHGEPQRQVAPKITRDIDLARRAWDLCEQTTGMHWPLDRASKARRR